MRVPRYPSPWTKGEYVSPPTPAITVHALKENKRPVGFAPWPEPEPDKPKPRRKKRSA